MLKFVLLELQYKTLGWRWLWLIFKRINKNYIYTINRLTNGQSRKMRLGCGKYKQAEKMENNWLTDNWLIQRRKQEGFPIWGFLHHGSLFFSAQQWKLENNLFFLNKFHTRVFDKQTHRKQGNLIKHHCTLEWEQPIYLSWKHLVLERALRLIKWKWKLLSPVQLFVTP